MKIRPDSPRHVLPAGDFPIQEDEHFLTVLRYVERNPVCPGLVAGAQRWPWSSAGDWDAGTPQPWREVVPVPRPAGWRAWVSGRLGSVDEPGGAAARPLLGMHQVKPSRC